MGWVLDHSPAEGAERLVLLSLANHAGASPVDGAWESYPGVETIKKEANLRRLRTVQEVLARLIAGGHIERVLNGAPDDRIRKDRRPNLYRILVERGLGFAVGSGDQPPKPEEGERGAASRHLAPDGNGEDAGYSPEPRGDASRHPDKRGVAERHPAAIDLHHGVPSDDTTGCRLASSRGAVSRRDGVPSDGTQTIIEPSVEPSVEPKTVIAVPATARSLALVVDAVEQLPAAPGAPFEQTTWDRFWNRWPRKTHKQQAREQWRRLTGRGVSDIEILASLNRWVAYWDLAGTGEQFIPYPANWLAKGDWAERPPSTAKPKRKQPTEELHGVLGKFMSREDTA